MNKLDGSSATKMAMTGESCLPWRQYAAVFVDNLNRFSEVSLGELGKVPFGNQRQQWKIPYK